MHDAARRYLQLHPVLEAYKNSIWSVGANKIRENVLTDDEVELVEDTVKVLAFVRETSL